MGCFWAKRGNTGSCKIVSFVVLLRVIRPAQKGWYPHGSCGASIPILAKLTPNVARMSPEAEAALSGGADGLSAINTIKWIVPGAGHADAKNTAPKEYFTHVFDFLETYMRAD